MVFAGPAPANSSGPCQTRRNPADSAEPPGRKNRTLVGDATTIGRPSKLYEVRVDYNGRNERFYEWVDVETGVVLKLVSQDRDWSIEYLRIRFSPQPEYYFDEPTGYKRWDPASTSQERG